MEPDKLELKVRAVCGLLLGCLLEFGYWLSFGWVGTWVDVLFAIVTIGGCIYGAVRYGDRFWTTFLRYWGP